MKRAFGDHAKKLAVSSTKSMTGHLLGAAGVVEAIFSILAHPRQRGAADHQLRHARSGVRSRLRAEHGAPMKIDVALSNSFGFGGTNGTVDLPPLRRLIRARRSLRARSQCDPRAGGPGHACCAGSPRAFPIAIPCCWTARPMGRSSRMSILAAEPRAALWLDADGQVAHARRRARRAPAFCDALEQWWLAERMPWQPDDSAVRGRLDAVPRL